MTDDAKFAPQALTFDDVLLLPAQSDLMPSVADTTARLSRAEVSASAGSTPEWAGSSRTSSKVRAGGPNLAWSVIAPSGQES